MEWFLKYSDMITWAGAILSFVVLLFIIPGKEENGWGEGKRIRQVSFFVALPIFSFSVVVLDIESSSWHIGLPLSVVTVITILRSIVSAIVLAELFRVIAATGAVWSAKRHFTIFAVLAVLYSGLLVAGNH